MPRHRHDFLIIHATLDHHVDLDRTEPDVVRDIHAVQYVGNRKINIIHAFECRIVERVERHRDALQAGIFQ